MDDPQSKQVRKGFRTKARDGDFIEFKFMLTEIFKNFDQNSNQKTEFLPIGKVYNFQWRRCLQNSSKYHKFRWLGNSSRISIIILVGNLNLMENLKNLDQNSGEKFERFQSEFWWWTSQMTMELFKNCNMMYLKDFDQNSLIRIPCIYL